MKDSPNEHLLWSGYPSLWKWFWSLLIGVLTLPIGVGVLIVIWVFIARSKTRYTVTSKRVGIETGVVSKRSQELRIQDIRSIEARSTFGYGHVEFSTAASDDAGIIFSAISEVEKVRDLVKSLQG